MASQTRPSKADDADDEESMQYILEDSDPDKKKPNNSNRNPAIFHSQTLVQNSHITNLNNYPKATQKKQHATDKNRNARHQLRDHMKSYLNTTHNNNNPNERIAFKPLVSYLRLSKRSSSFFEESV
eukprot:829223_1